MDEIPSQEGHLHFPTPLSDKLLYTFYKVIGDLKAGPAPLVVLHGGPGSGHEYLLAFAKIWGRTGIPVIFYDQIGCASSTRVPEKFGDKAFWQPERFLDELDNLLHHFSLPETGYHVFGHSWGGLLAAFHAARRPRGLRRLILGGTPASGELGRRGFYLLKDGLPTEDQQAINEAIEKNDFESQAYVRAMQVFYRKHWSRAQPFPGKGLDPALEHQAEDKTTRSSMMGPSPYSDIGPFSKLTVIPQLHQITCPTLLYSGEFDSVHDVAITPLFENIPRVRWMQFANGSHMLHADTPELQDKVLTLVGNFLLEDRK